MPASLLSPLILWMFLLPSGNGIDPGSTSGAHSTFARPTSNFVVTGPVATISAWFSESDWEWQISEADTAEEESGEGDDFSPILGAFRSARPGRDPGIPSAIRRSRGMEPSRVRSPILRC
ncbi:hypothetical protein P12x_001396 [Tundrisphaera lichenicola]|uniref:hypothetical protein n=1 Tax=Tundrisphaera lichenicola TaxID=2029860 RepID=UPI003EB75E6E